MSTATFIHQVAVFDGTRPLPAQDVLINDGTIAAVAPALAVPHGATVVDGAGQTLLPGLIDAHTHTTHALPTAAVTGLRRHHRTLHGRRPRDLPPTPGPRPRP